MLLKVAGLMLVLLGFLKARDAAAAAQTNPGDGRR